MKTIIFDNLSKLYMFALDIVVREVNGKKNAILGLATGRTPERLYDFMIRDFEAGKTDYGRVVTFNLDEYVGLSENHKESFRFFMNTKLFNKVNFNRKNIHFLNGCAQDFESECKRYEQLLGEYPRDLQLLGLGVNGHIGFNEPTQHPVKHTHLVSLSESTKKANADFFGGEEFVPDLALTMGIDSILSARKILLIATGESKAKALFNTLYGIDERVCPSAALRRHNDTVVLCDRAAAQFLKIEES